MESPKDDRTNLNSEEENIDAYEVRKWKQFYTVFQDNFKSLLRDIDIDREFGDDYLTHIGERRRELFKTYYKLSSILLLVVLFLGIIDSGAISEITIFGTTFLGDSPTLAVLLLVSSLLTIAVSMISLMEIHYSAIIDSIVEVKKDTKIGDYYKLQFIWSLDAIDEGFDSKDNHFKAKILVGFIAIVMGITVLLVMFVIGFLQLYILVSSIISVIEDSHLPGLINTSIVIVGICAVSFYLLRFIFLLPLPYSDYSNLSKLEQIEQDDPKRAYEIKMEIAKRSLKKERRNVVILQLIAVIAFYIIPLIAINWRDFFSSYASLIPLIYTIAIFMVIITTILDKYEAAVLLAEKDDTDESLRVSQYVKDKKKILRIRIVVSILFGLLSFMYYEWDKVQEIVSKF